VHEHQLVELVDAVAGPALAQSVLARVRRRAGSAPAPPRLHEVLAHIDRFLPEGDDSRWGPLRTTVGEVEYSLNQHREAIWSTGGEEEWEFVLWYKAPYESVDPNERAELRRILARIQQLERGEDESLPYWLADVLQHGVFKRKTHGRRTR
jgi:hypothetical protein